MTVEIFLEYLNLRKSEKSTIITGIHKFVCCKDTKERGKKYEKMKNKFIVNGKIFTKKYISGVQRYTLEIIKELDNIIDKNEIEICVPKCAKNIPNYKNLKIVKYSRLREIPWEQIAFPYYVAKNNGISINLGNVSPLLNPGIVCIHDLDCIKNPQYYPKIFSLWYKILIDNSIKKAQKIITVSNFSKCEIENYYNVENIQVIYNSYEHINRIKEDDTIFERLNSIIKGQYFFTLGTVQKNKNLEWILEIAKKNPDKTFVITGYKNQKNIDFNIENIIYTGYLKDSELKSLMKNCRAYIMPSFYEGFGIPVLEAFSLGKDVIVSDIPVMHEIFENEANYINPNQYDFDFNNIIHSDKKEKILEKFSWENSAKVLLNLLK